MRRRALERLEEHQRAILALMADGEDLLGGSSGNAAELARARWALMRALTAYQLFKHREIFDPAIAGSGGKGAQASRMKAACTALGDDFRLYVQKWSATDVEGQWTAYRPAAQAMIARIRSHIARERAEAAALLAG